MNNSFIEVTLLPNSDKIIFRICNSIKPSFNNKNYFFFLNLEIIMFFIFELFIFSSILPLILLLFLFVNLLGVFLLNIYYFLKFNFLI